MPHRRILSIWFPRLGAERLILVTDVDGVVDGDLQLISSITDKQIKEQIADGRIKGGMIPKVQACVDAVEAGVGSAHMVDGRIPHVLLLELFTDHGAGSQIRSTEPRVKPRVRR